MHDPVDLGHAANHAFGTSFAVFTRQETKVARRQRHAIGLSVAGSYLWTIAVAIASLRTKAVDYPPVAVFFLQTFVSCRAVVVIDAAHRIKPRIPSFTTFVGIRRSGRGAGACIVVGRRCGACCSSRGRLVGRAGGGRGVRRSFVKRIAWKIIGGGRWIFALVSPRGFVRGRRRCRR